MESELENVLADDDVEGDVGHEEVLRPVVDQGGWLGKIYAAVLGGLSEVECCDPMPVPGEWR